MTASSTCLRVLAPGLLGLALAAGCQPATPTPSAAPTPVPVAEQVQVGRVVDGDTVLTGDGRTVRVLGIDACELGTAAGDEARDEASAWVAAQPVVLRAEPDVDRTPDGMLLRHVEVAGVDWGRRAVPYEHTGAVPVSGVAAATYVSELRSLDTEMSTSTPPVARACEATTTTSTTTTTTSTETATDDGDPDRRYRPGSGTSDDDSDGGSGRTGSGSSSGSSSGSGSGSGSGSSSGDGHPCGPGERDGDGDGLCGES